jgi:ribosome-associated toxin RatA of RatAB toxin-antitoxin module
VIHQIRRSAIVQRTDAQMFALVNDVESYPRRFKWCVAAHALDQGDNVLIARLELRVGGFTQAFSTRNTLAPPRSIDMQLVDGPFSTLKGGWTFAPLGATGCKVSLALDFEYAGRLMAPIMRAGFEKLADRLVDEFCRTAMQPDA